MKQQRKFMAMAALCLGLLVAVSAIAALLPFMQFGPRVPPRLHMQSGNPLEGFGVESRLEWDEAYMAVYYPRTQNEQVNLAIRRWVDHQVAGFQADMRPSRRTEKDEFSISFRVFRYDEEIVSFLFQSYTHFTGHSEVREGFHAMTFDLSTGDQLGIAALFETADSLELLSEMAEGTQPLPEQFEHFILDGDTLRFYFPENQAVFELQLTQVQRLLRPRFSARLPAPEPGTEPHTSLPPPLDLESLEGKKVIALTFDDGPSPEITPLLLDYLKQEGAAATFFVLGDWVEQLPAIVARMAAEGHQVGNHTYNHRDLTKLTSRERRREISRAADAIKGILGYPPSVTRPPFGAHDEAVQADLATPLLLWSIDPRDWENEDAQYISEHVIERAQDGDIVVMHDLYEHTLEAVKSIVPALHTKGFAFVTIDQLLALRGGAEAGEIVRHRYP